MTVCLATVCPLYLAFGITLVAGFDVIGSTVACLAETRAAQWMTLVIGLALAGFGIL